MGTGLAAVMILEKHFPLVDKHKQPRGRSRVLSPATRILVALPGAAGPKSGIAVAPWHAGVPG